MLTTKQKLTLVAVAGGFGAQAFGITKAFHSAFGLENQAHALRDIVNKHSDILDESDLQKLRDNKML